MSLGVESGDPRVRALYGKTWDDADLAATVADLKAAGLGVGLVTLAGAGGVEHADRHLAATADLIAALDLGPGDLVSLLDSEEVRDPDRGEPGFTPPTAAMVADQQAELKRRLSAVRRRGQGRCVQPRKTGNRLIRGPGRADLADGHESTRRLDRLGRGS